MKRYFIGRALLVFAFVMVVLCFINIARNEPIESSVIKRMQKVAVVRSALQGYEEANGVLPKRLSQLYPDYLVTADMDIWFSNAKPAEASSFAALRGISRIDENCDYVYFPLVDPKVASLKVVLCERPYSNIRRKKWVAIMSDFSVRDLSREQLLQLISRNRPRTGEPTP
jgi:hypothetical protein